jgi:hypothetical protein
MTMLPIEIAWQQGVASCSECETGVRVTRAALERLREQAASAGATIKRLLDGTT